MGPFGKLTSIVRSPHPGTRAWKPFKLVMAGSPTNPAWIHNLRARFLEVWPVLEVYESRTSRAIPFVRLEPRSS